MAEIFLPTLHTFAMDNLFTGSWQQFRYRIVPTVFKAEDNPKEVDFDKSSMTAEFWHGEFCYEMSQAEGTKTFPMSEKGYEEMRSWLLDNI